jgi:radical SAM superfamily enzyme YgiQ (UPF0313 family)
MLEELQTLYSMGWRRQVHFVDDNFTGNPVKTKAFLKELIPWMEARGRPFQFFTYSSVLLATFPELLELMPRAGFIMVMLGIESLDKKTLKQVGKSQNTAVDLEEACRKINRAGLEIQALTMVGFDNEDRGVDSRIIDFAERNNIPEVVVSLLQAFPGSELYNRLKRENRLAESENRYLDWYDLEMNFVPTRPPIEIMQEFVRIHQVLYNPHNYLERAYHHFVDMDPPAEALPFKKPDLYELRALLTTIIRQGVFLPSRAKFWKLLFKAATRLSRDRFTLFVRACIKLEYYLERREKLGKALAEKTLPQAGPQPVHVPAK